MTLDRRTFIGTMGATLLAARYIEAASLKRLGAQLYTVRTLLEKDLTTTLAKVAGAGYAEVEFAGYFNQTSEQVRAVLWRHKLTAPPAPTLFDSLTLFK